MSITVPIRMGIHLTCAMLQVDVSKDARALQKLRREAERAKRALSSQHQVRVEIESLAEGVDLSEPLTRARFEELNNDLFKKTLGPVKRVSVFPSLQLHHQHAFHDRGTSQATAVCM